MIQTQRPTTQPLPVLVNERLCQDPGSCRCMLTHVIGVCVCVCVGGSRGAQQKMPVLLWLHLSCFLAICSKSNGTKEQIIRNSGFAALDARMHLQCYVEATIIFIPRSSHQSVSRSIICRSVLQASGTFFFLLTLKPLVRNCCQEPLRPPEGVALLFSGVSCSLKINCALIAWPDERRGENVQVR